MFDWITDPLIFADPGAQYEFFNGGWVDSITFVVALLYAVSRYARARRSNQKRRLFSPETGRDTIHGLPIFPLLLLMLAVGSPAVLEALLHAHKVILGAAGFAALCSILNTK
jgi:hypothetical protein